MVFSGFAALGYQIVWTQQCALWLGHEAAAVVAVVAAFFGGVAAGAWLLGQRIDRSLTPAYWYAACEAVIGLWSLALAFFMAPLTGLILDLVGADATPARQWSIAFAGTFLLLLPATAAMGATLPAMERCLAWMRRDRDDIAALYASNTFGAVLGVLATAFWLVPEIGLTGSAMVCAALNLASAALALRLFDRQAGTAPAEIKPAAPGVLLLLASTGLLGIGYEVLVVRVLSLVTENTVYTFAILLAVYLVGTALGAAIYDRWMQHPHAMSTPERMRDRLLRWLAAACVLGIFSLASAETIRTGVISTLGGGMAAALTAEVALATTAFLLPAIAMGALFSHLCIDARAKGIHFGRALAVNTVGAALAPPLFGVILMPALGAKFALLSVVAGYLALSIRHNLRTPVFWVPTAAVLLLAAWGPTLEFVDVPQGGRIVSYRDGAMAAVSIVEDTHGVSRLRINNRQQEGSSATLLADARQALLPILLHPSPKRALFLGLGTGVTASSAALDTRLEVDAVELLPEVVEASAYFSRAFEDNGTNPRLHVMTADARRYVRTTALRYDVIVSDNFHPARSGSGALYTVQHFAAVRERLAAGGLFCQWLPLHQLDLATLRSIVRTFMNAYPNGWAMLATNSLETPVLGLVARGDGQRLDIGRLRGRLADVAMPQRPAEFGIADDFSLLGGFIAGPRALVRFAGDAPLNTDDRPVVTYRAPRITYAADSLPRDRLFALLRGVEIRPEELIATPYDVAWASRLAAYWSARDRFLQAGRDVQATNDPRLMLAQVREPLLTVLRISPDFRPAYDPLLRMAVAIGGADADAARALLEELQRVQPSRPEASQALREFRGKSR